MKRYRQQITDPAIGDCFRACMATLLQLPMEVLPNDHSPAWHSVWQTYLKQFGLALSYANRADQPIWYDTPWIASVKSLNYDGGLHAILMHNASEILHDPSTKKRYKTGSQIDSSVVVSGKHLVVADASKLHLLKEYQDKLTKGGEV